jgi:hypothetical protein
MNRKNKNYWLNVLMLFQFTFMIISSYFLHSANNEVMIWGLSNSDWVLIHAVAGIIMTISVFLHLIWHGKWFKKTFNKWLSVVFAIASISGLTVWAKYQNPGSENILNKLHSFSTTIIILLIIWHLIIHRKWLVYMVSPKREK